MLSPVYKHPADGDPFAPGNYPDHMADAVTRSDVELGPMPGTDQLEDYADGELDHDAGTERLWWRPVTGALFSTRAGGTLIADHLGRRGHRATKPDRDAAITDMCRGLAGFRSWSGRGTVCTARHSLVCAAMASVAAQERPVAQRYAVAAFLGQHDLEESLGHGDIASPVGRLTDGLFREHRLRATAAAFHLVRPMPIEAVSLELLCWAERIDQLARVMEYAWDFGRLPPWLNPASRESSFASHVLHNREGRIQLERADRSETMAECARLSADAADHLAELLIDTGLAPAYDFETGEAFLDVTLLGAMRKDPFGEAALCAWSELGHTEPPALG